MKKVALFIIILLILAEIIIRLTYPYQDRLETILNILEQDSLLFWKHRPNLNIIFEGSNVRTNSQGLRADKEYSLKKEKGAVRIICLGASPTFGWGVDFYNTYPQQLEKILQLNYPPKIFEVINAGIIGYSSYQGILFLKNKILKFSPDIITVSYVINDVDRHRFFRSNGKPDNEIAPINSVAIFLKNTFKRSRLYSFIELYCKSQNKRKNISGFRHTLDLPKIRVSAEDYRNNLEEIINLAHKSNIKIILVKMAVNLPLPPYVSEISKENAKRNVSLAFNYIKSNRYQDAVLKIKEAFFFDPYLPEAYFYQGLCYENLKSYDMAEESFKKLKNLEAYRCRTDSEKYNKIMEEVASRYGIYLVDIVSIFKRQEGKQLFVDYKFDSIHPNKLGHRIIAEEIYSALKQNYLQVN